jgi:hypothetical protein
MALERTNISRNQEWLCWRGAAANYCSSQNFLYPFDLSAVKTGIATVRISILFSERLFNASD